MTSYLLNTKDQQAEMLQTIGIQRDDLFKSIPDKLRLKRPLKLPKGQTEMEVFERLSALANQNKIYATISGLLPYW